MQAGRADLADRVRHIAEIEGYGLDYDGSSFEVEGSELHIEVKTTRGGADKDFFVSANEVEFSSRHSASYCLYRLYDFESLTTRCHRKQRSSSDVRRAWPQLARRSN